LDGEAGFGSCFASQNKLNQRVEMIEDGLPRLVSVLWSFSIDFPLSYPPMDHEIELFPEFD
jgi:hypothetical protein